MSRSSYTNWSPEDVKNWIINLNPSTYKQYDKILSTKLVENGINGNALKDLDRADLKTYGIINLDNRKTIYKSIQTLISSNKKSVKNSRKNVDPSMGGISSESNSFYRFPLPKPCVAFPSDEGIELFGEALAGGYMNGYFELASQFRTQPETTYCGLASLTMVLNALAIDPKKQWKGHYRWYDEEMLDCNVSKEQIKSSGLTFDQCVAIARCNSLQVISKRPRKKYLNNTNILVKQYTAALVHECRTNDEEKTGFLNPTNTRYSSLDEFREDVILCSVTKRDPLMILCYSRLGLNQIGTGHFSPIAGYNKQKDMVLIMDVARFKYQPHWTPLETLYNAMSLTDSDNKSRSRGWMICSIEDATKSYFFTFNQQNIDFANSMELQRFSMRAPSTRLGLTASSTSNKSSHSRRDLFGGDFGLAASCNVEHKSSVEVISCLGKGLPPRIDQYLQNYRDMFGIELSKQHEVIKKKIFDGLQSTGMYSVVQHLFDTNDESVQRLQLKADNEMKVELMTLMLLVLGNDTWEEVPEHTDCKFTGELVELSIVNKDLYPECIHEIVCLRKQLANLDDFLETLFCAV